MRPPTTAPVTRRTSQQTFVLDARALALCAAGCRVAAVLVALAGLIGLCGWIFDLEQIKALAGGALAMKANTSLCLLLSGLSLLALSNDRRPVPWTHALGWLLALFVCAMGAVNLAEHLLEQNVTVDEMLFDHEIVSVDSPSPLRMSLPASMAFLLGGLALLLLDWSAPLRVAPAQYLALLVALIAAMPLIGHAYGIEPEDGLSEYTDLAVNSALAVLVLSVGLLMARPRAGLMATVCADDPGGMMARRLIIPAVLIPFLLGWLRTYGEKVGLIDDAFGQPFLIIALIAGLAVVVWWNARSMSRLEADRAAALAEKQAALRRVASEQESMAQERKRLIEELREHAEQLSAANAAKDRFIAVLSHELRTPLTPVLLSVSMLEQNPELPQSTREDLSSIRRNVELEAQLISDLLDLTRISRGKLQLQREEVDLHQTLRAAIEICQRDASANLIVELSATRRFVTGDATRLQQVFWNLIGNAQKFTPERGAIFVRSGNTPDGIRIDVRDTGAGIDPEVLPRLFNAFEQGHVRSQKQQAGLGLGLAITKAVVEAHGGRITAHSEGRGRGARFTVELPARERALAPPPARAGPVVPDAAVRSQALSVLLVEDHEPTLRAMSKLLERMGHRVTSAATAQAALAAARQDGLDLLVCDLGLPDGSGLDVMRQLRRKFAGRAIALTGYGMEADIRASLAAGFAEHITKPVDSEALQAAMRRVAGGVPASADTSARG